MAAENYGQRRLKSKADIAVNTLSFDPIRIRKI